MWTVSEEDLHVGLFRHVDVARIERTTSDFTFSVDAVDRFTDSGHGYSRVRSEGRGVRSEE
jgi:hypothetical protein